jgi:hypothetical protein
MKFKRFMFLLTFCGLTLTGFSQGLVGKLKQKAEQAAEKALEKKADPNSGANSGSTTGNQGTSGTSGSSTNSGGKPSNQGGGGLISTPPDVKQNLADAETSFKSHSYGDARYAVQQAMLGVEMEIGNQVLKSLPETVSGLPKQVEEDKVTSTGWGWAGLTIQRAYRKDDKQLTTTIANNAAWMSAVNMYLTNGGYSQQTNGEQNWKQVKVKGHRAVIEYNESSGYKLSVPLGQSSLIVWEGINFKSEQDMLGVANAFDIDGIKKMLGEK